VLFSIYEQQLDQSDIGTNSLHWRYEFYFVARIWKLWRICMH